MWSATGLWRTARTLRDGHVPRARMGGVALLVITGVDTGAWSKSHRIGRHMTSHVLVRLLERLCGVMHVIDLTFPLVTRASGSGGNWQNPSWETLPGYQCSNEDETVQCC